MEAETGSAPAPIPRLLGDAVGEKEALSDAGVLPAWEAVIQRDRLLGRRGDSGAISGRVVLVGGALWLVDETEGAGSLGVPLLVPAASVEPDPGARLVAWGAWDAVPIAGETRWAWRAERLALLAPEEAAPGQAGFLEVASAEAAPEGAVPVSEAEGDQVILFFVLAPPARLGDAWTIGDGPKGPPTARLFLPGERAPYGGQDLTAPAERWELGRGILHAVRIAPRRRPRPGATALPVFRAVEAPVAVVSP